MSLPSGRAIVGGLSCVGVRRCSQPIAARGPFVMNTDEEIMQANRDFRSGKMGH